jgi:alpha-N-arabinofuranosidase
MRKIKLLFLLILVTSMATAKEYHVAKNGDNRNSGTSESPFLSIQAAANVAQPGDIITVHEGIYRERITPPRGGESETKRIVYQVAEGEKVEVKDLLILKRHYIITDFRKILHQVKVSYFNHIVY